MPLSDLYYTAPENCYFNELRDAAIKIWESYGFETDYAQSKINRIVDLENVSDNFMYIVAMFDMPNQRRLSEMISDGCRDAVCMRLIAGGQPDWANPFLLPR